MAQKKLIFDGLINRPHEALQELLTRATGKGGKIFQTDGYPGAMLPVVIVTKHEDVCEILDNKRHPEMTVEFYRQKMEIKAPRPPRGSFILGKEPSDDLYKQEAPLIEKAVTQNMGSISSILTGTINTIFANLQEKKKNGLPIDLVRDIAWPVPLGLTARYFGVPGPDPDTLRRWLRHIYRDLFHNLEKKPEWVMEADVAVVEMNAYLDGLIQQHDTTPNTVLRALIAINNQTQGLKPHFVRRNIMGLTVGVVETTLKAIARTVDQLIRRPQQLEEAQAAAKNGNKDLVLRYVYEAMRFNPMNHVLYRKCSKEVTIAAGTPREARVKTGTMVFASTLTAMFDEDGPFKHPKEFRLDRKQEDYLFFGHGVHECMGRHLIPTVIQEVFMQLLTFTDLQRANNDPFDPIDLFPEHFYLEFKP